MKKIETTGVIGFGVMGSAIAISAASAGYDVIFKELNDDLVNTMFKKWVTGPLAKKVEKNKISQQEADEITQKIKGTSKYTDLFKCDLIIEAAVENFDLKKQVFKELSDVCRDDTIIVSNTSTFPIRELMADVKNPKRTAGLHYFFPANVNKLVEVIRQEKTSDETYAAVKSFAEKNKKTVISVKDFPGFAVNPVFIASYMVLNSFYGNYNAATLESISKEALGLKFGILWVQNFTGIGTSFHAAQSMYDYLAGTDVGFVNMPEPLANLYHTGETWNLEDGPVIENKTVRQIVIDQLYGAIFTMSTHLTEKKVVTREDLEKGIKLSLAWPEGPFALMEKLGQETVRELIIKTCYSGGFKLPQSYMQSI
ncbi:MAG: 3-hydroxyacyl-CoA dehydrogenase family protein [Desulfobacteraceae bacterium]